MRRKTSKMSGTALSVGGDRTTGQSVRTQNGKSFIRLYLKICNHFSWHLAFRALYLVKSTKKTYCKISMLAKDFGIFEKTHMS